MYTVVKWIYNGEGKPYKHEEKIFLSFLFADGEVDDTEIVEGGVEQVELYEDGERIRFKDKDFDFVDDGMMKLGV